MSSARPHSKKSDNSDSGAFEFGPLRGRPEFFYDHVPACAEDPNCYRSTCGYCHPKRDSQATHWSWVYPLEPKQPQAPPQAPPQPQPQLRAVPPLLFGKQYENLEQPASMSRDASFADFMLPNFDFLDTDPPHNPGNNPWDFRSTDLKSDGPSLRKIDSPAKEKVKSRKRIAQSSLRTSAPAFQPSFPKRLEIQDPPLQLKGSVEITQSTTTTIKATTPSSPLTPTIKEEEKIVPDVKLTPIPVEKKAASEDEFLRRMEAIKLAKPIFDNLKVENPTTTSTLPSTVAETSKVVETTPEKQPSTTTVTATITTTTTTTKSISKSIPLVPPFKSKLTTHTRTEQESLTPLLPLRGGSSTNTTVITETVSPKKSSVVPKSLPIVSNLVETSDDDSSQILDTGAKAPNKSAWFVLLWAFICSWSSDLAQDIKGVFAFLWVSIILRLPFLSDSSKKPTKPKGSSSSRPQLKKPTAAKHFKGRPLKSESSEGRMRK